ncbi:uncharacterized protein TNCV_2034941 [Trichonephila clavipes]|nr:uncharacterized protein TNCV_2034941 [Trichonephila clavipes]
MRARAYCAHPSIRDHWALRCLSRCLDQVRKKNILWSKIRIFKIDLPPQEILVHTMWLSQVEKEHYHVVREACIKNMEKFNIFRYDFKLRDFDQHACNEMILPVENLIKACSYFILSPENCTDIQKNKMTNKQVINTLLINASRDSEETERKFINALNEMLLYILKRTENIFSEAKGKLLPDSPSFDEGADRVGILLSLKSGLRTTRLFLVDAVSKIIKKTPNEIIDIVISTFTDTCEHNLRRTWIPKQKTRFQSQACVHHELLKVPLKRRIVKVAQSNRKVTILQIASNLNQVTANVSLNKLFVENYTVQAIAVNNLSHPKSLLLALNKNKHIHFTKKQKDNR